MDKRDRIWILMARALSGESTQQEKDELLSLLKHDPELHRQYRMLKKLWNAGADTDLISGEEYTEKSRVRNILKRGEEERSTDAETGKGIEGRIRRLFFSRTMQFAYAAVIAMVLIVFYYPAPDAKDVVKKQEVVAVQNGSRTKLLLPDGSSVWLNGDSKLYYDPAFAGSLREVYLEGEAFFDVVKQPKRPFIVHAGKISIKVLGTAFNVKFYKEDKNIETTLLRGKIEVSESSKGTGKHILLKPNQKLIVPVAVTSALMPEREEAKIINLDVRLKENEHIETSWIYNRIEFRGENFEELARKLERWYNVTIEFEDERCKELKFNGSFEKETIEEAFNALQKVGAFTFKIHGNEIFVKSSE